MLFKWEQSDAGRASQVNVDTGNNALFRTYLPGVSKQRTFPAIHKILQLESSKGETLPSTNRLLHFKFIAHDSMGATVSDAVQINVVADEKRFRLHIPPLFYTRNEDITVTWEVANTHLLPVACSSVNISLSTDNGLNFNQILAINLPNTGTTTLALPSTVTSRRVARLKLSCSDNIFFSISPRAFGTATKGTETPTDNDLNEDPDNDTTGKSTTGAAGSFSVYWLLFLFGFSVLSFHRASCIKDS